jgi:hypothetical protein
MSCLRPTQVITNWIGENSLLEQGLVPKVFRNKVNQVFYSEDDIRLKMYYGELYQQQLSQTKKTIVEMVPLPKEHVPYQPTLLPKAPASLSQRPSACMAKGRDIPHSATAPHVDMPDVFLLGP